MNSTIASNVALSSATLSLRAPAFAVINALQDYPPATQIQATFVAAVAMAQSVGLDPHQLVSRSRAVIDEIESTGDASFEAIREYASGELK